MSAEQKDLFRLSRQAGAPLPVRPWIAAKLTSGDLRALARISDAEAHKLCQEALFYHRGHPEIARALYDLARPFPRDGYTVGTDELLGTIRRKRRNEGRGGLVNFKGFYALLLHQVLPGYAEQIPIRNKSKFLWLFDAGEWRDDRWNEGRTDV